MFYHNDLFFKERVNVEIEKLYKNSNTDQTGLQNIDSSPSSFSC